MAKRSIQNIKIGVFGTKGVGKTTFFTMLYHSLVNSPQFTDFACVDPEAKKYYQNNINFFEQNDDWDTFKRMAGTGQAYDISGILRRIDKVRYNLIMKDYMGENATSMNLNDDEIDMTSEIRESVYNSDLLICLIDVESSVSSKNNMFKRSAIEDVRNMLRGFLPMDEDVGIDIPVAIVLNKVDVVLPKLLGPKNILGLKEWFERASGNLVRNLEEDFSNIKTFFYSSKEYHEKWYSQAGGNMHKEIDLSRENGLEVLYDPSAPLVWGIAEQEEKLKKERISEEKLEISNRYSQLLSRYNSNAQQLIPGDKLIIENSANLLSKYQSVVSLLETAHKQLTQSSNLINNESDHESIDESLSQAEVTADALEGELKTIFLEIKKIKDNANNNYNKIEQIAIDVNAKITDIDRLSKSEKVSIRQQISQMEEAKSFIVSYKTEARKALQEFGIENLRNLKDKAKGEKQRFDRYHQVAMGTIKKQKNKQGKKSWITVLLALAIISAFYFAYPFLVNIFSEETAQEEDIESISTDKFIYKTPLNGVVNSTNGVRVREGPSLDFRRRPDPTGESEEGLGIGYNRFVTITQRTTSKETIDACSDAAGTQMGYWYYAIDKDMPINEGWVWGNCITIQD